MSSRPSIDDPDDWYNRWIALHHAPLFPGRFAGLALSRLSESPDGMGAEVLRYIEDDGTPIEVEVTYFLETFPKAVSSMCSRS